MAFKDVLSNKDVVYGVFVKTCDPFFVEVLGRAGFDFAILDNEHGPNSPRELYPLVLASWATGMYPVVRVGKLSDIEIQRVLDLGVAGVQIPQIQTRQDAEQARAFTRFHPKGSRGVCRFVRAADFSLTDRKQFFQSQNDVVTIIMLEGLTAIRNLDEILTVPDLDVIFIGPYDMSQALGIPGEIDNPLLLREIEGLVARCRANGKTVGIFVDSIPMAQRYRAMGIKYIAYSVDVGIFAESCKSIRSELDALQR